ncbi:uncharacterized protein LOC125587210 [Brassica napus]|uniref:uncharacterized protein LOC125587210 n=1 Tax=Brassica napus TaxID=3708 RepID=UPI00207AA174|nr:uncharacterized protein LOC125587210 [Brassica napus]
MIAHLHQIFSERLDTMQSMVERLPRVAPPIWKSNPDSYADTLLTDEVTLIEMPRKFSFPSIKAYDGTTDPDDHVPKGSREATMCKGFGSTLTGPALQWYINLPSRSIASFAVLSDKFVEQFASSRDLEKTSDSLYEILQHRAEPLRGYIARFNQEKVAISECSIPTAISAFKRGMLPDGDLYKELNKYQCKTMEDVLSRAWAQVKWEEDVASRAKVQQKQDPKTIRPDQTEQDEKPSQRPTRDSGNRNRGRYQNRPIEKVEGMAVSTWPDISHLLVSTPELINVLRQMGQQVKWPQKMKASDSFRNPGFWEFLSEKAKSHLSKETAGKPTEAAPVSPPQQDQVIHVISGGSEIKSHAAAKKSTWNAKHDLEEAKPKRLLLGTDEIRFTAKEQEKVLTPHHDSLVISLTVANCLVKRILLDNGSSDNIIFQAAYKDLGLEESALTRRITPLIGFSGEVKQTAGEVTLPVYAEGVNMSTKFLVVDCDSSYNMILQRPWIDGPGFTAWEPSLQLFTKWCNSVHPGA